MSKKILKIKKRVSVISGTLKKNKDVREKKGIKVTSIHREVSTKGKEVNN